MGHIQRKSFYLMQAIYLVKLVKWAKYYPKNCFSKFATYNKTKLFWCLEAFLPEFIKTSLVGLKCVYLRRKLRISQKLIFSQHVRRGVYPKERYLNLYYSFDPQNVPHTETKLFRYIKAFHRKLKKKILFEV